MNKTPQINWIEDEKITDDLTGKLSKQPKKEGLVQSCREKKGFKKPGRTGAAEEGKDILKLNRRKMALK